MTNQGILITANEKPQRCLGLATDARRTATKLYTPSRLPTTLILLTDDHYDDDATTHALQYRKLFTGGQFNGSSQQHQGELPVT